MPVGSWSTTAADNATADSASGISWAEGMSPAQVNNSSRAMMAEVRKLYDTPTFPGAGTFTGTSAFTGLDAKQATDCRITATETTGNKLIQLYRNQTTQGLITTNSDPISFSINTTEVARITPSGGMLMGTTTGAYGGQTWQAVASYASNNGIATVNTLGSSFNYAMGFHNTTGFVGSISTNGSATAFNTSSDKRLKDGFAPLSAPGEVIDALEAGTFTWLTDGRPGVGVLAQDAYNVVPEAVVVGDDDPDAKPSDEGFQGWAVDYSKFVPYLLAEVKALRVRVAALEQSSLAL